MLLLYLEAMEEMLWDIGLDISNNFANFDRMWSPHLLTVDSFKVLCPQEYLYIPQKITWEALKKFKNRVKFLNGLK